jgi:hypothetical protein
LNKNKNEGEPRYDREDFTKPGTLFNKPGIDAGFTEGVLEKNKLENIMKLRNPTSKGKTTEELELSKCTFKPYMHTKQNKFNSVKPRLLDHYKQSESMCEEDVKYIYEKSNALPDTIPNLSNLRMQLNRSLREPSVSRFSQDIPHKEPQIIMYSHYKKSRTQGEA